VNFDVEVNCFHRKSAVVSFEYDIGIHGVQLHVERLGKWSLVVGNNCYFREFL